MGKRFLNGLMLIGLASVVAGAPAFATVPAITVPPVTQTIYIGDSVTFSVNAGGTAPLSYQWYRDGTVVGGATGSALTFMTSATDDDALFSVQVGNASGSVTSDAVPLIIDFGMGGAMHTNRLVEITTPWRYDVSKTDLGSMWRLTSYSDGSWASGGGLLYVESDGLPAPKTTALPLIAKQLPSTCYFRTWFTSNITNAYSLRLEANTVVDDGVVVYLNGTEVLRNRMAAGTVSYSTGSDGSVNDAVLEGPFDFSTDSLAEGDNLVAVEVHQTSSTSSDIVMGLTLDAIWQERLYDTVAPVVDQLAPATGATVSSLTQIQVTFDEGVAGVDAADLLINGVPATSVSSSSTDIYQFYFAEPAEGVVDVSWAAGHGITDRSVENNVFAVAGFSYLFSTAAVIEELELSQVYQSSDFAASTTADQATDGSSSSYSQTKNMPGSFWMGEMGRPFRFSQIELTNRTTPDDGELGGLTLTLFNMDDQVVYETVLSNPTSGGRILINLPHNTIGRTLRIGLSGSETNDAGNYGVGLAEVRVFGSVHIPYSPAPYDPSEEVPPAINNLASFKPSYMLSLSDSFPAASTANDDNLSTGTRTSDAPLGPADPYWEVDLGETFALYGVRAFEVADLDGCLKYTTCRLYDENHDSVFDRQLGGEKDVYDVDLNGPVLARYVRIGLEDKIYSHTGLSNATSTDREWRIGWSEVEVFGRAADEVGIQSFTASANQVSSGQSVTLNWLVSDVKRAEIHPAIGSVGAATTANGRGTLSTSLTHSTEFILLATNHAGIFSKAVGVEVDGSPLSIQISEVAADNTSSLKDGYGDAPDWVELRNTGNSTIDLTGWGLSDNLADPMKWIFPATNMLPHSTLIVFASKNDSSIDPMGNLHADFKLASAGDSIYLTASDGTTMDHLVDFPALDTDLAYGRDLDGNWTFMEPTPDAVNTGKSHEGWLKSLDWSHSRGFYETNFTLTVTSENPEATILYSLDGSVPSIPYTAGLSIDETQSVRIQSVRAGYKSPRIQTKTFIFLDDVMTSPMMDTNIMQAPQYAARLKPGLLSLPTLSLVVPETPTYDEQEASIEVIWPNGESSAVQENCGVARIGGAWTWYDKHSFSLSFRTKYGAGKLKAPLFNGFDHGVLAKTSFDKLHLRAGNQDMQWRGFYMSDRFIQDSYLDMGSLNPHGRFVHVYINGVYWGQYNCKEVLMESFLADYLGGEEEDYVSAKGDNLGSDFAIGVCEAPDIEPWERVRSLRNDYEAITPYLDVKHYIDFMLLFSYGYTESEFRACGPKEAGSGFKFWVNDPDGFLRAHSMIGSWEGPKDRLSVSQGPGFIWGGLTGEGHVDFKTLLADRIYKNFFNNGAMTPAACDARLLARLDEVRDSILLESARWSTLTTNHSLIEALTPAEWESKAAAVRSDLFPTRTAELLGYWETAGYYPSFDPPAFNQYGGPVGAGFQPVLTSSAGTIYYTLNGTDPRLSGGGISPTALVWSSGAVTITEDTTMTVRVRKSDGTWSALAEPRYLLGSRQSPVMGDLLITEVNYNPDGADDYEFIEIWNSGTKFLDLSGVTISNAVRYIFPEYTTLAPGQFMLVVEDAIAFSNRYQNAASPWYWDGTQLSGEWVGGLSDGGETIALVASDGSLISTVGYRSDGDWPERPNGGGSSLEVRSPALVPNDAAAHVAYLLDGRNWSASQLYHGSPGRFESVNNPVVINEILSHTDGGVDWIELYNPSGASVDLSGLAVTDHLSWPDRYILPGGTTIEPYGYLTLSATTLGYGFSELGAEAALLELSGSHIIALIDHVIFPAVQREEPFGRYDRSDGEIDFTELRSASKDAVNELPRVGPVVISEIVYAPEVGKSAYIEIMNIHSEPIPLYDVSIPSNTWEFSGVGDFSFPTGTVLQGGEAAVLCATNPSVFRVQYGTEASVKVFGPWSGNLSVDGEKLQLLSPGDPEPNGAVPLYRADHVSFRTNSVWPDATHAGSSLERSPLTEYGNDPAHWRISPISGSPGFATEYIEPFVVSSSGLSEGLFTIAFPALYAQSYEIQYTGSLLEPDWKPLSVVPFAASNWVGVVDSDDPVSNRYYRVILLGFPAK